jgi:hypothetical protein
MLEDGDADKLSIVKAVYSKHHGCYVETDSGSISIDVSHEAASWVCGEEED